MGGGTYRLACDKPSDRAVFLLATGQSEDVIEQIYDLCLIIDYQ